MLQFSALFTLTAEVAPAIDFGLIDGRHRRLVPVVGGSFSGARLSGAILAGGSDVQIVREDGTVEIAVHAVLQTREGENILLKGTGLRHASADPEAQYFREAITFEVAGARLDWMNRLLAVGTGYRKPDSVELAVFEIL